MGSTILVDSDGVVVDFVSSFLEGYKENGGVIPEGWELSEFDSISQLPSKKALKAVWNDGELFARAKPYKGALEALRWLNKHHEVFIVTAYGRQTHLHVPAKHFWYKKHAKFLKYDQVVFTNNKLIVKGDILIEDKGETIMAWALLNKDKTVYRIVRPWNRNTARMNVFPFNSLHAVVESLKESEKT